MSLPYLNLSLKELQERFPKRTDFYYFNHHLSILSSGLISGGIERGLGGAYGYSSDHGVFIIGGIIYLARYNT